MVYTHLSKSTQKLLRQAFIGGGITSAVVLSVYILVKHAQSSDLVVRQESFVARTCEKGTVVRHEYRTRSGKTIVRFEYRADRGPRFDQPDDSCPPHGNST